MAKQSGGTQLVVDIDAEGKLSATAVRRTLVIDDDDGSLLTTKNEAVTFDQLGDEFPWTEFVGSALQAALLNSEETDQLREAIATAEATIQQKDAEAAALTAKSEAWKALAKTIAQNAINTATAAYNDITAAEQAQ